MNNPLLNSLVRFWSLLVRPHSSVTGIAEQRRATLTSALTLVTAVMFLAGAIAVLPNNPITSRGVVATLSLSIFSIIAYIISRTRFYLFGGLILPVAVLVYAFLNVGPQTADDGMEAAFGFLTTLIILAFVIANAILSTELLTIIVFAAIGGHIYTTISQQVPFSIVGSDLGIIMTIGALLAITNGYRNKTDREQVAEITQANQELREAGVVLESRVQERTRALEEQSTLLAEQSARAELRARQLQTISELSNTVSTIDKLDLLLPRAASLVAERFGFYHVGIFLLDANREFAIFSGTNSEGGFKMLERGHRLRVGQEGIVGYVAATGRSRFVSDTGADAAFFNNPDLPETRAEAALPLIFGEQVIGVLDVQSTESNAFNEDMAEMLPVLAAQVAIAISNVRALEEARRLIGQMQTLNQEYTSDSWHRLAQRREQVGIRFTGANLQALPAPINTPQIDKAIRAGSVEESKTDVAIPISLRGKVIGAINVRIPAGHEWTLDEKEILQSVAERVALSLENARLVEEAQVQAGQERALAEMSNKISSSFRFESILRTAAEELSRALSGSEILVQISPQAGDESNQP